MRYSKFILMIIIIFFSSCGDEYVTEFNENVDNQTGEVSNLSSFSSNVYAYCADAISDRYVNLSMRSYLYKMIKSEVPESFYSDHGVPVYNAIMTQTFDHSSSDKNVLSMVPIYQPVSNQTSAILFFVVSEEGINFMILKKIDLNQVPDTGLAIASSNEVIEKKELLDMFSYIDFYINCSTISLTRNPCPRIKCPSPKGSSDSFWDRLWDRITGFLGSGSGSYTGVGGVGGSGGFGGSQDFPFIVGDFVSIPPNILPPGSTGPENPINLDDILLLQTECDRDDSENEDGAGIDQGQIVPEVLSPTAIAIHEAWCRYQRRCPDNELINAQPLIPPISLNNTTDNPYLAWANFWSSNTEAFLGLLDYDYGCKTSEDLDEVLDCENAIDQFEAEYEINLSDEEKSLLRRISSCGGSGFDEDAGKLILGNKYGIPIDFVLLTDGLIIGSDEEGRLKVYFPDKVNPHELTLQELFDRVALIMHCSNLYFCETQNYLELNWQDYFEGISSQSHISIGPIDNVNYKNCNTGMILDFTWGGMIMDLDPSANGQSDSATNPRTHWRWPSVLGANRPILQISTESDCAEDLINYLNGC